MANDKGKKAQPNVGELAPHRAKSRRDEDPAQRSQTRRMRCAPKEKDDRAPVEEGAEPNASLTKAAAGEGGNKRARKSVHHVKQECKQKIIAEMDQIVTGLIEKAKRGSYNEAKLLLTIADKDDGKKAEDKAAQAVADASLAELLLGQLGAVPETKAAVKKQGGRRKKASGKVGSRATSPSRKRQKQPSLEVPEAPKKEAEPTIPEEPQGAAEPTDTAEAVPATV
jgi:hypothetical protein